MNSGDLWYRPGGTGWSPALYDWFFGRTRRGIALRAGEEAVVYRMLGGRVGRTATIVEYGPGTGHYTLPLARRCARLVAVEPSSSMRGHLRERLQREGIRNVEIRSGLLEDGLGGDERFDGALAIGPLYYARDLPAALSTLAAGLKPGGWSVFSVPLRTPEGAFQLVNELLVRRRIFLRHPGDATLATRQAGCRSRASELPVPAARG